jgi:hypothetical protein
MSEQNRPPFFPWDAHNQKLVSKNDGNPGLKSPVNRQAGKPALQVNFGQVMERLRWLRADISPLKPKRSARPVISTIAPG